MRTNPSVGRPIGVYTRYLERLADFYTRTRLKRATQKNANSSPPVRDPLHCSAAPRVYVEDRK